MLRLLQTLAFCFWCFLLLHRQAVADEEALWGPTPSRENPPESSYWYTSFLKLPFRIPFYGSSDVNDEATELTTTAKGQTEQINGLQDHFGSGEESLSEASEPSTTSSQGLLTSVTKIGTESLPTGTSDSPHSSIAQSDNEALVLDSYSPTSSSIRNTLVTNSPTSTSTPEQNATHTHPPRGIAPATTQQLPEEHADKEAEDFTEKIFLTIAPETTVPTALTWAAVQTTTTTSGPVETTLTSRHPLGPVTPSTSSETTFVRKPQDSTVGIALHAGEATMTELHPTQSEADLGFSEARSGPLEEQPGVTSATGIDHKLVPESITSTTKSQWVNFPIAGGKQS